MPLHDYVTPHPYPGKLIIVEGIDGSGKSTQLDLLRKYLESEGHPVHFTEWNSSALVKDTTKKGKKQKSLTPTTFSILHCCDFAERLAYSIIPPLKGGMIVLADRYMYTAFARDVARGVSREWVRGMYSFAPKPDIAYYFQITPEVSVERILTGRPQLKYYEAGLDVMDTDDPVESFGLFQGAIVNEYDAMVDEFGLTVIDGTRPIYTQQQEMRAIMAEKLGDYLTRSVPPRRGSTARRRTPAKASTAKRPTAASTKAAK
ncbi:MAG: thymidylate kinase [Armatimonadetes bacterium]|jgi:dTMP kinase|nr:thymidylate kinase [Armatimonadota bacterium]MDI9601931.1 thymidylate kinase [Acidobacteriota bacterium]NLN89619.1 thymidylate kinase [candidate division WS1 bacterium]